MKRQMLGVSVGLFKSKPNIVLELYNDCEMKEIIE